MKAFTYKKYGTPEVLTLEEVPAPMPKANEIKIKVKALSINPAELHLMRASIWMVRLSQGLMKPKKPILGADVAGVVVAVGGKVTDFEVGDKVLGRVTETGLAEYTCLKSNQAAKITEGIDFETAAAIPLAATTALVALRKGNIQSEQRVLINGASGGIGTFAVQLAKMNNAIVTGVCSAKNTEWVRNLGADEVIDYTSEDFTTIQKKYDLVIDLIGNRRISDTVKALTPSGKCVVVGFTSFKNMLGAMTKGSWISATTKQKVVVIDAPTTSEDLAYLIQLVHEGKIQPVIEKIYPFEDMKLAFEHLSTRRAKGKIVVRV